MKKFVQYSIVAVMVLSVFSLASCSNDDIEISRTNKLTLAVNTQQAYDQLGLTNKTITDAIGEEPSIRIGVTLFFYNTQGKLARKEVLTSRTFVTHYLEVDKMDNGDYTVIAVETFTDSKGESNYWTFTGEEQLTTLRLDKKYESYIRWTGAVALDTRRLTVGGTATTYTITPAPIGYLLQCEYAGIKSMKVTDMLVNIKNESQGIWLDPTHDNVTKFYYEDYNSKDLWTPIAGFSDNLQNAGSDVFFAIETGLTDCLLALIDPNDPKHRPADGYWNFTYEYPDDNGASVNFQIGKTYETKISYNPSTSKVTYYFRSKDPSTGEVKYYMGESEGN